MALKNDFYSEIFENEQKWIELINKKLLNSIYCKFSLQPFYEAKRNELVEEYSLAKNEIIKNFIIIISNILSQTEILYEEYMNGKDVNMNSLIPLFLTTQMSNSSKKEEEKQQIVSSELNKLQIKKQILENEIKNYDRSTSENEDYVYDDFPEETKKVK